MRAKLIDGALVYAPRKIQTEIDGKPYTTYNPKDEQLAAQGWLNVVETEHPEPPIGYEYRPTYAEVAGEIVQSWELVEAELTAEQALSVITGGAL